MKCDDINEINNKIINKIINDVNIIINVINKIKKTKNVIEVIIINHVINFQFFKVLTMSFKSFYF